MFPDQVAAVSQPRCAETDIDRDSAMDDPIRILIVDDDPSLRSLIRDFLAGHGYVAFEADGGNAMRSVLDREAVDVVVLDVMMPGEDGLALARSISVRPEIAIIMVSALGSETDRIIGLEVGADDYLAKPVSPRELLARIRAVLRRQRNAGAIDDEIRPFHFDGWRFDPLKRVLHDPGNVVIS